MHPPPGPPPQWPPPPPQPPQRLSPLVQFVVVTTIVALAVGSCAFGFAAGSEGRPGARSTRIVTEEVTTTVTVTARRTPSPSPSRRRTTSPRPRRKTSAPAAPEPETDRRYSTCAEVIRNGRGPYYKGADPEYSWYIDRDGDGVVCES